MIVGDHLQVSQQINALPLEAFFRNRLVHISPNELFHSLNNIIYHVFILIVHPMTLIENPMDGVGRGYYYRIHSAIGFGAAN